MSSTFRLRHQLPAAAPPQQGLQMRRPQSFSELASASMVAAGDAAADALNSLLAQAAPDTVLTEEELLQAHHSSKHPGYQLRYHGATSARLHALSHGVSPPTHGCFTVPRFQFIPAAEALAGLVFANFFWVGLWDLLDSTIFPQDSTGQMMFLVVVGTLGLYFTNSLYEPPQDKFPHPPRKQAEDLSRPLKPSELGCGTSAGTRLCVPLAGGGSPERSETSALRGGAPIPLEFVDEPCVPPRFEIRRFAERTVANVAAVFVWVGVWDSIDDNILPVQCSYNACGDCTEYGQFPCAWYKIVLIVLGLAGQYVTRGLYCDHEVAYMTRREQRCCNCGWSSLAASSAAARPPPSPPDHFSRGSRQVSNKRGGDSGMPMSLL